jgi:phage virion morphogenesis protein
MIEIELKDDAVVAALARLDAGLRDPRPLMQEIGELLVESTKDRFKAGTAPDGSAWAPKTQATRDAYARRGERVDERPLWGPSRMLASQIFPRATSDRVEVGSNRIYAAVMQFGAAQGAFGRNARGSPIPWGDIPARPFLGVSAADREGVLEAIGLWLGEIVDD